jgi:alkaline phosphatase D
MTITGNWDGRISRRTLLRTGGSAAAGLVLLGHATTARAVPPFDGNPFSLGVASGDPTPDGIVLWTRLAPAPLEGGGLKEEPYGVRYELAADEDFRQIVRRGAIEALPEEAHTVHVELSGLTPATTYWYRFKFGTEVSTEGRTRTAPAAGDTPPGGLQFAFVSCQNWVTGYYHAYDDITARANAGEIELVVHLGDYIYEGDGQNNPERLEARPPVPLAELRSLADYRTRHAQYRTDAKLQAAHAAVPWLMTWDDHELEDNYADLAMDPEVPLETAAERRAAAYLAYWEHAPLSRSRKPVGKDMNLYRRLKWGSLATFHVLDTRQYRSDQIVQCPVSSRVFGYCPPALDDTRGMLGDAQREWLFEGLAGSGASWNVIANQVAFAPVNNGTLAGPRFFMPDKWDGYVADRQRVLDFIAGQKLTNTVVITGDAHVSAVRDVPPDFRSLGGDPIATEFIGTSISSGGDPKPPRTVFGGDPNNPHIHFFDDRRGYARVVAQPDVWTTEYRAMDTVTNPTRGTASTVATFSVARGNPGAELL